MSVVAELPQVELSGSVPVRRQLTDSVRSMIRTGEIKPGVRLPASQELARRWKTDAMTVHRALTPLVREGLIELVQKQFRGEKCDGIYVPCSLSQ